MKKPVTAVSASAQDDWAADGLLKDQRRMTVVDMALVRFPLDEAEIPGVRDTSDG
jgi:hypothetical protein